MKEAVRIVSLTTATVWAAAAGVVDVAGDALAGASSPLCCWTSFALTHRHSIDVVAAAAAAESTSDCGAVDAAVVDVVGVVAAVECAVD